MALVSAHLITIFSLLAFFAMALTPAKHIKYIKHIPTAVSFIIFLSFIFSINKITQVSILELYFDKQVKALGVVFSFMSCLGFIYSLKNLKKLELCIAFLYYLSSLVLIASTNLLILVLAWEAMAVAAAIIIFANKTPESFKAGLKYSAMHFMAGCLLLTGVAGLVVYGVEQVALIAEINKVTIFILLAILVNLAIFPFSSWLTDGYSSASYSASVFLSTFTTKATVLILIKFFAGLSTLVPIGIFISVFGIIMACFIKDARKMLGYGIMAQVGIMVSLVGYNLGNIAMLVAFTHIVYKGLMFMLVGSLMYAKNIKHASLKVLSFNYKYNKSLAFIIVFTSLTSLAMPFSATVAVKMALSKYLEQSSLHGYYYFVVAIGALTAFNIGAKLPYFLFFNNKESIEKLQVAKSMYIAMYALVGFAILLTVMPFKMLGLVLTQEEVAKFNVGYIFSYYLKQLVYVTPAILAFYFTRQTFAPNKFENVSSDMLYKLLYKVYTAIENTIITSKACFLSTTHGLIIKLITFSYNKTESLKLTNYNKATSGSMLNALMVVFAIIAISIIITAI